MSTAGEGEVRLRKGTSLNERLVLAGIAVVVCLIALPGLAHLANDQWLGIGALFALLFGCLLLGAALFDRNVVWIVTSGEILIGEQRPFGKLHRRSIRDDELSGMRLRRSIGKSVEFTLVFETGSGDTLTSPPLPDVTQVQRTIVQIAQLLQLPAPELIENPLDAANAGIRLGKPVSSKRVQAYRALARAACLLAGHSTHLRALERQIVRLRNRCRVIRRDRGLFVDQAPLSGEWMLDCPRWRPQD